MTEAPKVEQVEYAPCPLCQQYSHSIGSGAVTSAFNHFQTMIAHPVREHPMGDVFDAKTKDAAQVLLAHTLTEPERTAKAVAEAVERYAQIADNVAQQAIDEGDGGGREWATATNIAAAIRDEGAAG